ncbi:GNAT family N-acetyltransferase [Planomonospora sp. ID82291]|nr:GNAT family N-acetyltransferase [Planomonospora sp. ID82291]
MRTQLVRPYRDPSPAVRPAVRRADAGDRRPGADVEVRRVDVEVRRPGADVEVRPARTDDEERIRRFLAGLSPRTQTLRFFTGLGRPAASLVRALLVVDERRDVLLAVCGDEVVGHAMSSGDGGAAVEIAVVVADGWQGLGLGSRLVRRLLRRAEAKGARTVGMDVMAENRGVLAMIGRKWPDATLRSSLGTVEVTAAVRREVR